ncbi:pre-mRNA-splicing factor CWC25-like protein [Achlya hypogyna]|uniref:Pre-mRNA-splicing factor CWC25-like protein n=1 Tax=Achlya hypogyna TaxID=1202772 RepID=A0A1V9YK09_ACHHY|nr:pre-mRNA-splicing factor CWC25-like protein [Achlya hypogyna]
MSLAFLAKKSWHTSNLKNVEKVWKAEQKHAQEENKLLELRKNLEEERQLKELRELQAKTTGKKLDTTQRVDWMYEGPMAASQTAKTAEDYLLGKEYKPEAEQNQLKQLSSTPGSLYMSAAPSAVNDSFSRLNEDPMMMIKRQQKAAQIAVLKNPAKMKKLKDKVEKELSERKIAKLAKKEAKKAKKAKKDKKRSRSPPIKFLSPSHRSPSPKRARSTAVNDAADSHTKAPPPPLKGYGVIGGENAVSANSVRKCKDVDTSSLGPSRKLLEMAREKKAAEAAALEERLRKARVMTQPTAADREERLREMADDARRREVLLEERLRAKEAARAQEEAAPEPSTNPTFLQELNHAAYIGSSETMSERLNRNKHYIQRNATSNNFMK